MRGEPHGKRESPRKGRGRSDDLAHDQSRRSLRCNFIDAEIVARGSTRIDGEDPWSPDAFSRRRDLEIESLSSWATQKNLWLPQTALAGSRQGGLEHNLLLVGDPVERIWKVTKGSFFGTHPTAEPGSLPMAGDRFVMRPATPRQYLARMILMQEIFPALDGRLEGFAQVSGRFAIVTSQRFIAAEAATPAQIGEFLGKLGYRSLLREAWFHPRDSVALFDVTPSNVLHHRGKLFPIDVIPIRARGKMLQSMKEILQLPFGTK